MMIVSCTQSPTSQRQCPQDRFSIRRTGVQAHPIVQSERKGAVSNGLDEGNRQYIEQQLALDTHES
jgi:hypothetical protein